ncbi:MAG: hypothetical protein ABW298_16865 [Candidatus Binatia bacterium]
MGGPVELKAVVADGWFAREAEVLDIGSGRGHMAAWWPSVATPSWPPS